MRGSKAKPLSIVTTITLNDNDNELTASQAKLFDTDNRTVVAMELSKSYCIDNNQAT